MTFLTDMLAAVGGTSHVRFIRVGGINQTVSGGLLQSWDDARGSSGFGPTATAFGSPKPSVNGTTGAVTCDGSQNYYETPASSVFEMSVPGTFIFVGTPPEGYSVNLEADPVTYPWESLQTNAGKIQDTLFGFSTRGVAADGPQIVKLSFTQVSPSGGAAIGDRPQWIETVGHVPVSIFDTSGGISGDRVLRVGKLAWTGGFTAPVEYFCMLVDHQLTSAEHDAVVALLTAQYAPYIDTAHGSIIFDGDSRTVGAGLADATTESFPAQTMATLALGSTYESLNAGVTSRMAYIQLQMFDTRIAPLFRSGKTLKQIYVIWGSYINDYQYGGLYGGFTPTQIRTHIVDNCLAARARGAKVVVATELPWTGSPESDRLAFNTYVRANYTSFADELADIASITGLDDPTTADFQGDHVHPSAAGAAKIANDATYGVAAAITRVLTAPTFNAAWARGSNVLIQRGS